MYLDAIEIPAAADAGAAGAVRAVRRRDGPAGAGAVRRRGARGRMAAAQMDDDSGKLIYNLCGSLTSFFEPTGANRHGGL